MRTNLRDSVKPDMLAPGTRAKIIARNTFQFTAPNADRVTRLHLTDIVRVTPKGKTILDSGGWRTKTTKERMDAQLPAGYRLTSEKGPWYIMHNVSGYPWDKANPRVAFYDGIAIPDCFNARAIAKSQRAETREQKLRLQVRKFVGKLDRLQCLPNPGPGDCWLCCLRDKNGATMGAMAGHSSDSSHIVEHVREGYLHGSLIVNALHDAGYNNPQFIGAMDNQDMARGKKPDRTKRALKRYLYRKLGLAA